MELIKKHGILLFWFVLYADCGVLYLNKPQYHGILKTLLMLVLMLYLALNTTKKSFTGSKLIVFVALFASWIGDILLLKEGDSFFIASMVAFIITHIFYSIFFYRAVSVKLSKFTEGTIAAFIIIIIATQLRKFLSPHWGEFGLPIMIYIVFIGVMAVFAANVARSKTMKPLAFNHFIPGAALFILSDAIIVLNKFYFKEEFLSIVIIMSYGYAQCLLVQGFNKYLKV